MIKSVFKLRPNRFLPFPQTEMTGSVIKPRQAYSAVKAYVVFLLAKAGLGYLKGISQAERPILRYDNETCRQFYYWCQNHSQEFLASWDFFFFFL